LRYFVHIKMAEALAQTECSTASLTNNKKNLLNYKTLEYVLILNNSFIRLSTNQVLPN